MTRSERVSFAFIREGTSDDGLIPHIRTLLVERGVPEVVGASRPYKGSVESCLSAWAREESNDAIVFVHRDADNSDAQPVRGQILAAAGSLGLECVVPVVPIQELEAWLLLSEAAIREVVGRPSGRGTLDLPKARHIEGTASPKEVLQRALLRASGTHGRRAARERTRFPDRRRTLLERLDIHGPVRGLEAWKQFERDLDAVALRKDR